MAVDQLPAPGDQSSASAAASAEPTTIRGQINKLRTHKTALGHASFLK